MESRNGQKTAAAAPWREHFRSISVTTTYALSPLPSDLDRCAGEAVDNQE